jgi:hypothetical protein
MRVGLIIVAIFGCLVLAAIVFEDSTEEKIKAEIEEYSGPKVSAEECGQIGENDGRTVYECFGETYTDSNRLGCYSWGDADNLVAEACSRYRAEYNTDPPSADGANAAAQKFVRFVASGNQRKMCATLSDRSLSQLSAADDRGRRLRDCQKQSLFLAAHLLEQPESMEVRLFGETSHQATVTLEGRKQFGLVYERGRWNVMMLPANPKRFDQAGSSTVRQVFK